MDKAQRRERHLRNRVANLLSYHPRELPTLGWMVAHVGGNFTPEEIGAAFTRQVHEEESRSAGV